MPAPCSATTRSWSTARPRPARATSSRCGDGRADRLGDAGPSPLRRSLTPSPDPMTRFSRLTAAAVRAAAVLDAATTGTTTTLDVKRELRDRGYWAVQSDVSFLMDAGRRGVRLAVVGPGRLPALRGPARGRIRQGPPRGSASADARPRGTDGRRAVTGLHRGRRRTPSGWQVARPRSVVLEAGQTDQLNWCDPTMPVVLEVAIMNDLSLSPPMTAQRATPAFIGASRCCPA